MAKTASGLVEYVKAQLGKPYWYGTYGQTSSAALYKAKKKQYPNYYTATNFSSQYNRRVHDCSGLIKGYFMSVSPTATPVYNASLDKSADGFYNDCVEKGDIKNIPEIPGIIVWKKDHIGVYIGNKEVVEARGHNYGVIKSRLNEVGWTNWGKLKYIDYSAMVTESTVVNVVGAEDKEVNVTLSTLEYGASGSEVKTLQILLNAKGYKGSDKKVLSVDGIFKDNTLHAVKRYQADKRLFVDGCVGQDTWTYLLTK